MLNHKQIKIKAGETSLLGNFVESKFENSRINGKPFGNILKNKRVELKITES